MVSHKYKFYIYIYKICDNLSIKAKYHRVPVM